MQIDSFPFLHHSITPFVLPPLAGIDPGVIIYLLLAVVWAFAKLANQRKRRPRGSEPPPPDAERQRPALNDELREMLETLTGQKLETPQPRPQAPPPPAPSSRASPPHARGHRQTRPEKRAVPPPAFRAPAPPLPYERAIESIAPTVTLMEAQRASAMSMTSQPVVTTSFRTSLMGSAKALTPPDWAPDLKQRDAFRAAILCQIILGPPRALERTPDHS